MTFISCQCEVIYYVILEISVTGIIGITQSRAVTLTVIAHLEETPIMVISEYLKLLLNLPPFFVFGRICSIKQLGS